MYELWIHCSQIICLPLKSWFIFIFSDRDSNIKHIGSEKLASLTRSHSFNCNIKSWRYWCFDSKQETKVWILKVVDVLSEFDVLRCYKGRPILEKICRPAFHLLYSACAKLSSLNLIMDDCNIFACQTWIRFN